MRCCCVPAFARRRSGSPNQTPAMRALHSHSLLAPCELAWAISLGSACATFFLGERGSQALALQRVLYLQCVYMCAGICL